MIINKITVGFVVQQYDTELKKFVGQSFSAADEVTWENPSGITMEAPETDSGNNPEPYLNFDMVQPN